MRSGRLREQVTILHKTATQDAYGQKKDSFTPLATVWAAVEPDKAREWFAAQQTNYEQTALVLIRYRADVTNTMQVQHGDTVYQIEGVIDPQSRHVELQLMCRVVS